MEGPVNEESSSSAVNGTDQLSLMHHLVLVVVTLLVILNSGINWLICILLICYIFRFLKEYYERERRRIQFEERRRNNTRRAMSEGETLRWVNESLKVVWPVCMQKFASQNFFTPMAPWFLDKHKPKYVTKVTMNALNLGKAPPIFSLIRVLQSSQDKEEVIYEAQTEFLGDEYMEALMTVRIGGVNIDFHISKLYMKGTVKFSLNFLGGWPVLGRIRFCFANAPIVDMNAQTYGIHMKYFPGAKSWLEETLGRALEQSVVEPYMLVIDMEKLVSNMIISEPRPSQGPQDFFSVEHKSGITVLVEILEAGDLKVEGLPNPIVVLKLGSREEKTKPRPKTVKPVWNDEKYRFPIKDWEYSNILILRVMHKKWKGQETDIGICSILVKEFRDGGRKERKLILESKKKEPVGWIKFAITVEHGSGSQSQEEPHTTIELQPQTQDIASITPPDSAATTGSQAFGVKANPSIHTGHSSTEVEIRSVPYDEDSERSEPDCGSTEFIKIDNIPDGSISIQFPEYEKPLHFPTDSPRTIKRRVKPKSKGETGSNEPLAMSDSKVKRSMRQLMNMGRKRNISKVSSHDKSPPEREMLMSEHSGYSSSLDCSSELKVYHGSLNVRLQVSPDMVSRELPQAEPHFEDPNLDLTTKLETVHSFQGPDISLQNTPDLTKTRRNNFHEKIIDGNTGTSQPEGQDLERDAAGKSSISSIPNEETHNSSQILRKKQNSKNSPWWSKFNLPKRRKKSRKNKSGMADSVSADSFEKNQFPLQLSETDTSATQSFREEGSQRDFKSLRLEQTPATEVSPENHRSILASGMIAGRSNSSRLEPSKVKLAERSQSMRLANLNTIHERHDRLDRTA